MEQRKIAARSSKPRLHRTKSRLTERNLRRAQPHQMSSSGGCPVAVAWRIRMQRVLSSGRLTVLNGRQRPAYASSSPNETAPALQVVSGRRHQCNDFGQSDQGDFAVESLAARKQHLYSNAIPEQRLPWAERGRQIFQHYRIVPSDVMSLANLF